MKVNQVKKWELIRRKGPLHFILLRGGLFWGLSMFIIMALVNKPFSDGFVSNIAIIHYVVWPVCGILFGILNWYIWERSYKKQIQTK